jgi:hypothetical protein
MAKRRISVEEFTNDVLAGMTDDELMQKYRISRKHLDAMFGKLLQRGELRPMDLADATQKILEPTLELAATCPECGALNLFGAGQCPECGHSRVTRHFKAIETQDLETLPPDSQPAIPEEESRPSEDLGDLEGLSVDLPAAVPQASGRTEIEPTPHAPVRPRRLFLHVAAAVLFALLAVVAVGVYTEMFSLPFGAPSPPMAVQKPVPGPAPVAPSPTRVAGIGPQPAQELPKPPEPAAVEPELTRTEVPPVTHAPANPEPEVPEPPSVQAPKKESARTEAAGEIPSTPTVPPVPEQSQAEPTTTPVDALASEKPRVEPAGHEEPSGEAPAAGTENNPPAVPATRETVPEKPERLASVIPPVEPGRPAEVEEPAATQSTDSSPLEPPQPDSKSQGETPMPEPSAVVEPVPLPSERAAAASPVPLPIEKPTSRNQSDLGPLLIRAAKQGDEEMLNMLMDRRADPDSADAEGATALMYAARTRCLPCVVTLLKRGADVRRKDNSGDTALDMARRAGKTRAAELILAHDPEKGPEALLIASREGLADLVQFLVQNGVDVNAPDQDGNTPLMAASETGHLEIVSILLSKGADVRARNKQGQTALVVVSRPNPAHGRVPARIRSELVRMLEQHATPGTDALQPQR